jgi:prevent-host-death family protein
MRPKWDYKRRRKEGDFGDAGVVTARELEADLKTVLKRVAHGEQIVVKRHGKPYVAIVATYDLQACQALEDYNDAVWCERMQAAGEFDKPGIPWEQVRREIGLED